MSGIESYQRLDIRYFHKNKLLTPGRYSTFSWTRGGEPSGNINVKVENDCLRLIYRYRDYGEEWQDVKERVYLDWTRCNYGGRRPWFLCPLCGRRVGILAAAGKLFLCRHCYRLKYWSQLETDLDRTNRKVTNLKNRLNRKGLHQKTRDRLQCKLLEAEMLADELFCLKAAKWLMRHP
jgi:hypothetical protein